MVWPWYLKDHTFFFISICLYFYICLSVYLSIYKGLLAILTVCLTMIAKRSYLFFYLSVYLSVILYLSINLSVFLYIYLSAYLSLSVYLCTYLYIKVCWPLWLCVWPWPPSGWPPRTAWSRIWRLWKPWDLPPPFAQENIQYYWRKGGVNSHHLKFYILWFTSYCIWIVKALLEKSLELLF